MTTQLHVQIRTQPAKTETLCELQEALLLPMQIALHGGDSEMEVHLSQDHWRVIEASIGFEQAHSCWACGSQDTAVLGHQPMWRFEPKQRLRTLVGFELLCTRCALGRDPVLAMEKLPPDELDEVCQHFRDVNRIDRTRYGAELTRAFTEWYRLRRIEWRTSFGAFVACINLPSHHDCVRCEYAEQLDLFAGEEVQS